MEKKQLELQEKLKDGKLDFATVAKKVRIIEHLTAMKAVEKVTDENLKSLSLLVDKDNYCLLCPLRIGGKVTYFPILIDIIKNSSYNSEN